jgi:hypothetical protein
MKKANFPELRRKVRSSISLIIEEGNAWALDIYEYSPARRRTADIVDLRRRDDARRQNRS